jgi:oxidase EvaA
MTSNASLSVARTAKDLERVLAESRSGFEVSRVKSSAAQEWDVRDGSLQHKSRGFFSIVGVDERCGAKSLLLYQPQGAVTGLLRAQIDADICYLLQARAEPGCLGNAQFGPTVQSTPANFMRLHGGAATPYIENFVAFEPGLTLVDDTTQMDLGLRYLYKTKRSILIEAAAPPPLQPSFVWATRQAICEACLESAFLNLDLRSILSIAAWSSDENGLAPRSVQVRRTLAAPIRAEALGSVLSRLSGVSRRSARFVALSSLENWRQTEWGWSERERRQGFDVDFFSVSARFREKSTWVQPLINSATDGHVILMCRERHGYVEFLVRVISESGLATSAGVTPSYVRYPGALGTPPPDYSAASVWSATVESDEGGRFYRDASQYEIVRLDGAETPSDGVWLRLSELKLLLRMSNLCTIQLRGVVSHLLGVEL